MGRAILAACGVPTGLFEAQGSSQGAREAWRQFIYGSVQPLANLMSEELSKKLETEVSLNFANMFAADIAARSTSLKKMVESGVDVKEALGLSGLMALGGLMMECCFCKSEQGDTPRPVFALSVKICVDLTG